MDADPDSTYHPDADPDSTYHLMRIRILIFLFDADPDPTFRPDADPDPVPSFKTGANPRKIAKIGLYFIHFGLISAN